MPEHLLTCAGSKLSDGRGSNACTAQKPAQLCLERNVWLAQRKVTALISAQSLANEDVGIWQTACACNVLYQYLPGRSTDAGVCRASDAAARIMAFVHAFGQQHVYHVFPTSRDEQT